MAIFCCSEFIPVFLGKIVRKIWNGHFWPFQIYTSLCGKIVEKNSEWPFLAIPNLYQSFWENCWEKFGMTIFGHSEFIQVFSGKIVRKIWNSHFWPYQIYASLFQKNCWEKNWNDPFLAILNLYQSFWGKLSGKIWDGHFWPYQIYTSLCWKNCWEKIWNGQKWPFQIHTCFFGKNCQKKFGTAIFGHSKFIPIFLGKLLGKIQNGHFWPFQIYTSFFWKNC